MSPTLAISKPKTGVPYRSPVSVRCLEQLAKELNPLASFQPSAVGFLFLAES
jgi:hypothetical protein